MPTDEQMNDLAHLQSVAEQFATEVVIIGAVALLCFVDLKRFTSDIDLVVALDLKDFAAFSSELKTQGWTQERHREHRWHGPNGSLIDLIPAGPILRAARQIIWPKSEFVMSIAGFEHVFTRSVPIAFASNIQFKVAPPPVIAILKIVAYMEDPYRREKDLADLKSLFSCYEAESDRIFGDNVFAAELEDVEYANAFLLGSDIGAIATDEDARIVNGFLGKKQFSETQLAELDRDNLQHREAVRFYMQLKAFETGFKTKRQ